MKNISHWVYFTALVPFKVELNFTCLPVSVASYRKINYIYFSADTAITR